MLQDTDQSIAQARARWQQMVDTFDQNFASAQELALAEGRITQGEYDSLMRNRFQYRSSLRLWAIIGGKFYMPSDVEGFALGVIPGAPQIKTTAQVSRYGDGPFTVVWAVNKLKAGTTQGFIKDEFNQVWIAELERLKLDKEGVPVEILDANFSWRPYSEFLNQDSRIQMLDVPIPVASFETADESVGIAVSVEEAKLAVVESGLFKVRTEYLIIGDEPKDRHGGLPPGVFTLKSVLSSDDYDALKRYFTMMPRSVLWQFFMDKIWPDIPWSLTVTDGRGPRPTSAPYVVSEIYGTGHFKKQFEDLVWGAFIDVFNEANLEHITKNQLDPWTWESEKTDAYYVSSNQEALAELAKDIEGYRDVALATDPRAKAILEEYVKLPKLGDVGLEINRQSSIKELLKRKEYETAQAIVDAFRYAQDTVIGETLTKPIPYDIVAADGSAVVKTTNA